MKDTDKKTWDIYISHGIVIYTYSFFFLGGGKEDYGRDGI